MDGAVDNEEDSTYSIDRDRIVKLEDQAEVEVEIGSLDEELRYLIQESQKKREAWDRMKYVKENKYNKYN